MPIIQPWFQGWGDLSLYICWICGLVCVCVSDCVCVILLLVFVKVLVFEFVPMCQQPLLTGCPCCLSSVSTVSRLPSTHTDMHSVQCTQVYAENTNTRITVKWCQTLSPASLRFLQNVLPASSRPGSMPSAQCARQCAHSVLKPKLTLWPGAQHS